MSADPYRTAALRGGVLAAWRTSPTRFREDANAEADLVRGGYADRLLVELAQNAADAAQRAGVPGRLRMVVEDGELRAANTGAPLDAEGVTALTSLRASAKRDGESVGRFGVGFAAVLAVTDAPRILSTTGGVAFSVERTAAAVAGDPPLVAELGRRDGRPPVLRLVWPATGAPPEGFDTEVRLPLRPGVEATAVLTACAEQAPDLLLALPWLTRIDVDGSTFQREGTDPVLLQSPGGTARWRVVRGAGRFTPDVLTALGPEARDGWSLCWALPVDESGAPLPLRDDVLHAPTRTAERLTLPARLIAGVPVEASRRHVQGGAATDVVLTEAARRYPSLAAVLDPLDRTALVPAAGFPAGEVDAALRSAVLDALREEPWLPSPAGDLAPARARVLDAPLPELAALLADLAPGLVDAALAEPRHAPALAALGVARLGPAAVVELLSGLDRPPKWWHRCYSALTPLLDSGPAVREELGTLPVPLVDGRTVTGPRGVLLGAGEIEVPGLRLAHPDAEHPLLERLGARPVGPAELLDALRPAVERSVDDAEAGADVAPLVRAVLALAPRLDAPPPWLGALALPDTDGEIRRADELLLPDAVLRPLLAADAPLGVLGAPAAGQAWDALRAVGVLDSFAVVDEPAPAGPEHDLADEEAWWSTVEHDPPARLLAVRDLDLVDPGSWPAALRLLASDPLTLAALREPRGYSGWWLARHARLGGHPPRHWRLPGAVKLAGLYDPAPVELPADLLAAAGVRAALDIGDRADAADLLDRLADPRRTVTAAVVHAAHAALAAAVAAGNLDPADVDPPSRVRARTGAVVAADRAVVLDDPWLAAVLPEGELVSGGAAQALAELLDLPLASEGVTAEVLGSGERVAWAALAEVVAACAAADRPVPEGELMLHERLRVRVAGTVHEVPYWVTDGGLVHAADPVRAVLLRSP